MTPSQSFHLRATDTPASVGTELPAGTSLDMLDLATSRRRAQVMLHVRVRATGAVGYTFVSAREIGPGCPAYLPETSVPGTVQGTAPPPEARRAPVAGRMAAINAAMAGNPFTPGPVQESAVHTRARMDLDGDGSQDEFVRVETASDNFPAVDIALLTRPGGLAPYVICQEVATEHPNQSTSVDVADPMAVGAGGYFVAGAGERASDDRDEPTADSQAFDVLRCRVGGPCPTVFHGVALMGTQERWTLADAGGTAVRLDTGTGRSAVLRWDPVAWRLVP